MHFLKKLIDMLKMMANKIVNKICDYMLDKKATDIQVIKVNKLTTITDYFIICTSESDPQTKAIAKNIKNKLFEEEGIKPWHIEGYENLKWILIDYVNIVVNIFNEQERKYYNLEKLWGDGEITDIKEK